MPQSQTFNWMNGWTCQKNIARSQNAAQSNYLLRCQVILSNFFCSVLSYLRTVKIIYFLFALHLIFFPCRIYPFIIAIFSSSNTYFFNLIFFITIFFFFTFYHKISSPQFGFYQKKFIRNFLILFYFNFFFINKLSFLQ